MHGSGAMADTVQNKPNSWQTFDKKKKKSEFRQTLKTLNALNVKYRKRHFLKAFNLMQVKEKKGISLLLLHLLHFFAYLLYDWRGGWTWVFWILLGCSTEEGEQAPSSVGLGLDHGSSTSVEDEQVAFINMLPSVHMGCHWICSFVWVQMPFGSVGMGTGVLLY